MRFKNLLPKLEKLEPSHVELLRTLFLDHQMLGVWADTLEDKGIDYVEARFAVFKQFRDTCVDTKINTIDALLSFFLDCSERPVNFVTADARADAIRIAPFYIEQNTEMRTTKEIRDAYCTVLRALCA